MDSSPMNPYDRRADRVFRRVSAGFGFFFVIVAAALAVNLAWTSRSTWATQGIGFLWRTQWDPVANHFGALPFLYGTIMSSLLALAIAVPLGVGSAIFLVELAPARLSSVVGFTIELLAAVPSVILGLVGIAALVPQMRVIEPVLTKFLGFLPLFRGQPYGVGLLTAGLILALMILPIVTVMTREVLRSVPRHLKEGMAALGATKWEVVAGVSLPYARTAIVGACFLALGRALGETMAVTMVIGNMPKITASLLNPAYTMAAVIANELAEAEGSAHLSALIAVGFLLLLVTIAANALARRLVSTAEHRE